MCIRDSPYGDIDNDGIRNIDDADNDNDGILDCIENGITGDMTEMCIRDRYKGKIAEKMGYQLGLRSETSSINIDFTKYDPSTASPIAEPEVRKNYTQFFPSVFLSYELSKNNHLLLNYARRINRPRAFSMIPFMSFDDLSLIHI